jgi:hypothetical protein
MARKQQGESGVFCAVSTDGCARKMEYVMLCTMNLILLQSDLKTTSKERTRSETRDMELVS